MNQLAGLLQQAQTVSGEVFWSALVFLLTCGLVPALIKMLEGSRFQAALGDILKNASWWQLYVNGVSALDERLDRYFGEKLISTGAYVQTFRISAVYTTIAFSSFTFMLIAPPDDKSVFGNSVPLLDQASKSFWVSTFLIASITLGAWMSIQAKPLRAGLTRIFEHQAKLVLVVGFFSLVIVVQYLAWLVFDDLWAQYFLGDSALPKDSSNGSDGVWGGAPVAFFMMLGVSVAITGIFVFASVEGIGAFFTASIASLIATAIFMNIETTLSEELMVIAKDRTLGSFFFLALYCTPFTSCILDTISISVTRVYIKKLIYDFSIARYFSRILRMLQHIGIDGLIGSVLLAVGIAILALTLIWSPIGELFAGTLDIGNEEDQIIHAGVTSASAFLMISSTLVPTAVHIGLAVMAIALQPAPLRSRAARLCLVGQSGNSIEFADKLGVALYIAFSIWLTVSVLLAFYYAVIQTIGLVFDVHLLDAIMQSINDMYRVYLDILGLKPQFG